jgi:hypothetical protein
MINFADDARIRLPLCDVLPVGITLPALIPHGPRLWAVAFDAVRRGAVDIRRRRRGLKGVPHRHKIVTEEYLSEDLADSVFGFDRTVLHVIENLRPFFPAHTAENSTR